MPLPLENIIDEKYGINGPFRVYYVPEGKGLEEQARSDYRQPISFDGNDKPLVFLQLTKNPLTNKFVPYAVYYDAKQYTDEQILSIPTLGELGTKCSYCQARNDASKALGIPDTPIQKGVEALQSIQRPVQQPSSGQELVAYGGQGDSWESGPIGQPQQQFDRHMDMGNIITPAFIPAAIDVFSKVFCEPFGEAILKIGMAGLASIAAGWASEGGTQAAWRKISEDIVREYKVCPTDIPRIQQNVMAMKDALVKDKANILGAMSAGTFKNFAQVAKEHGFEVSGQANIMGRASVSITPLTRGPGRAID
jgi:hypothetical protein